MACRRRWGNWNRKSPRSRKPRGARSLAAIVMKKLAAPYVAEADRTPSVMELFAWGERLLEIIHRMLNEMGHLKDEVAVLKGEKKRPTLRYAHGRNETKSHPLGCQPKSAE